MPLIRPCADLRNNYNEISKICHETNKPVYITKNGANDIVILSNEAFEFYEKNKEEIEEKRIEKLVVEQFDKYYASFEEFKKDFYKHIEQALRDVDEGRYSSFDEFCAELEEKYDLK